MKRFVTIFGLMLLSLTVNAQTKIADETADRLNTLVLSRAQNGVNSGDYLVRRLTELQIALRENGQVNGGRNICFYLGIAINASEEFYKDAFFVTTFGGAKGFDQKLLYRINRFGDLGRDCQNVEQLDLVKIQERTSVAVQDLNVVINFLKSVVPTVPGAGWPQ